MTLQRTLVGEPELYKGYLVTVRHMGPDLLAEVNNMPIGQFWLTAEAARKAARDHVDRLMKEAGRTT